MRYDWFCRDLNKGCAKEGGRVSQSKLDKSIRSANIASTHNGPQSIQIWLCPILEIPLSRCSISEENLRCLAIVFSPFHLVGNRWEIIPWPSQQECNLENQQKWDLANFVQKRVRRYFDNHQDWNILLELERIGAGETQILDRSKTKIWAAMLRRSAQCTRSV